MHIRKSIHALSFSHALSIYLAMYIYIIPFDVLNRFLKNNMDLMILRLYRIETNKLVCAVYKSNKPFDFSEEYACHVLVGVSSDNPHLHR